MSEQTVEVEKIDPEDFTRSINGFEEIAITQMFRVSPERLGVQASEGEPFMFFRSLIFLSYKRSGMTDTDAFRKAMLLTMEQVNEHIDLGQSEDEGKA